MKPNKTILLAEDGEDEFLLMKLAFRKLECEDAFRRVRNGEEVIRYLAGEGPYRDRTRYPFPSVVLLDLNMPLKNGFEVLDWIRSNPTMKQLAVTILSGSTNDADIDHAYNGFANSYLVKPTTLDALVKMASVVKTYWTELNTISRFPENEAAVEARRAAEFGSNRAVFSANTTTDAM